AGVGLGQREAAELLPSRQGGQKRRLVLDAPKLLDRVANQRVVDRENHSHVGAGSRDLLDHDRIRDDVHSPAAVLGRHRDSRQTELPRCPEEVLRKISRLVDRGRAGLDGLLGKLPNRVPEELLILRQLEIHGTRSIPGGTRGGGLGTPSSVSVSSRRACRDPRPDVVPATPESPRLIGSTPSLAPLDRDPAYSSRIRD